MSNGQKLLQNGASGTHSIGTTALRASLNEPTCASTEPAAVVDASLVAFTHSPSGEMALCAESAPRPCHVAPALFSAASMEACTSAYPCERSRQPELLSVSADGPAPR